MERNFFGSEFIVSISELFPKLILGGPIRSKYVFGGIFHVVLPSINFMADEFPPNGWSSSSRSVSFTSS